MPSRRELLKRIIALPILGPSLARKLFARENETEIFMNQFSVAGFRFYEGMNILSKLKPNDELTLVPDPDNEHDRYAVKILFKNQQIGFVPRSDNKHIFRLLQQKVKLVARIAHIQPEEVTWQMVQVKVWLVLEKV